VFVLASVCVQHIRICLIGGPLCFDCDDANAGTQSGGKTTISFSRPLMTADANDVDITPVR